MIWPDIDSIYGLTKEVSGLQYVFPLIFDHVNLDHERMKSMPSLHPLIKWYYIIV